ncbi:DnaJ family domain-containing protein [Arthrobacter sp. 754]|uniref:DnaJ family domain-containing protein n=1 Tax=Arthrobacter sp. 754 TaxID=3156315 RepID=UPI003391D078
MSGTGDFKRRLERVAELRSYRGAGISAEEEAELDAAEESERQKRKKVDDAKRAEYLIRDAMAQGKFDNLKYAGKPIPGLGEAYDPDWWVKGLIQRENISGLGPKAILLRTEDAELDALLDTQFTEKQVRDILVDFNARVIDARRQLQGGPPVITKTRDVEVEVSRWQERRAARAGAETPEPEPGTSRSWWQRLWRGTT